MRTFSSRFFLTTLILGLSLLLVSGSSCQSGESVPKESRSEGTIASSAATAASPALSKAHGNMSVSVDPRWGVPLYPGAKELTQGIPRKPGWQIGRWTTPDSVDKLMEFYEIQLKGSVNSTTTQLNDAAKTATIEVAKRSIILEFSRRTEEKETTIEIQKALENR